MGAWNHQRVVVSHLVMRQIRSPRASNNQDGNCGCALEAAQLPILLGRRLMGQHEAYGGDMSHGGLAHDI